MSDELKEFRSLLRFQLDIEKGFGVEFIPRSAAPPPPSPVAKDPAPGKAQPAPPPQEPARYEPASAPPPTHREPAPQRRYPYSGESALPDMPPAPVLKPDDVFNDLRGQVSICEKCELCRTRTHTVFGEGDPATDLVFVGEGPGEDEDRLGRPFVGRAGKLLTKIIHDGMKLHRHRVYICNVVKCRPPGNRPPTLNEMLGCRPYLFQQLRTIKPQVIVTLGATAVLGLLGEKVPITRYRGIFREREGFRVMPTFHPSYLLRSYTPEARRAVWQDMQAVMQHLKEVGSPLASGK